MSQWRESLLGVSAMIKTNPIKRMRIGAALVAATLSMATPWGAAHAGAIDEVRAGVTAQSFGGYSPDKEDGAGVNAEVLFASPYFLHGVGAPRPHIGVMVATDPDATSQVYAGLEWKANISRRFFVAGSVGGAVHNGETDTFDPAVDLPRLDETLFLGCPVLFRLAADVGVEITEKIAASITWSHISNAGLCDDNEGLDNLGVRVGYKF